MIQLPRVPADGIHAVGFDVEQDLRNALDDRRIALSGREVEAGRLDGPEGVGVGADESGTELHALI